MPKVTSLIRDALVLLMVCSCSETKLFTVCWLRWETLAGKGTQIYKNCVSIFGWFLLKCSDWCFRINVPLHPSHCLAEAESRGAQPWGYTVCRSSTRSNVTPWKKEIPLFSSCHISLSGRWQMISNYAFFSLQTELWIKKSDRFKCLSHLISHFNRQ